MLRLVILLLLVACPALAQEGGAARLGRSDQSSEYWDLTAAFDSGHRILARFSISNEGPGDRTGFALGQIVFPDGRIVAFQNGRLERNWRLSEDRLRMKIGSSVLDLHAPVRHFEVDKNKKGVKFFLEFEPAEAAVHSWRSAPPGIHLDLVTLGAPVRGTIWARATMGEAAPVAVEGRISVTHVWMDETESSLVRRRIEPHVLASRDQRSHAYLVEIAPNQGATRRWMAVRRADGSWHETGSFEIAFAGADPEPGARYPVPAALEISGEGVRGRIDFGRRIVEHDPLALAPLPFRWLLSFRTKPRQIWLDSTLSLEWLGAGGPFAIEGSGLSSFYFLNPMDSAR